MTDRIPPSTAKPRDLVPGDVIRYGKELAVVISNDYPATTVPRPENEKFCEPGLVVLKHFNADLWLRTHEFTYVLLKVTRSVKTYNAIRVQDERESGSERGKFLDEVERKGLRAA
jgi:hypothetical protein